VSAIVSGNSNRQFLGWTTVSGQTNGGPDLQILSGLGMASGQTLPCRVRNQKPMTSWIYKSGQVLLQPVVGAFLSVSRNQKPMTSWIYKSGQVLV
ncbi:hypothetical protein RRG08_062432, partial [Elysia crispata]